MFVGICDDEPIPLETLKQYILDYGIEHSETFNMFCYRSGEEVLTAMANGQDFDLLFLDVFMTASDGIATAQKIREAGKDWCIVFATNSREHAIESYGIRAIHYLIKPLTYADVSQALDRAREVLPRRPEKIVTIQNRHGLYKIPVCDILYAESDARVVSIHTQALGCIEYYDRLDNFELLCSDSCLLRCHKSYLVNLNFVQSIEENKFFLKTGAEIRISIKLSEAKSRFASYKASII